LGGGLLSVEKDRVRRVPHAPQLFARQATVLVIGELLPNETNRRDPEYCYDCSDALKMRR
jgi:hypothetical protein